MTKEIKLTTQVYTVFALIILLLALSGCAAFNNLVKNNELAMQLATEAATARVIHEHPAWKAPAVKITADAMTLIDSGAVVELSAVETYVKGSVNWGSMLPEEQALVSALITQVRVNLEDSFHAQGIVDAAKQMVEVRKTLGWMNAAAGRQ